MGRVWGANEAQIGQGSTAASNEAQMGRVWGANEAEFALDSDFVFGSVAA